METMADLWRRDECGRSWGGRSLSIKFLVATVGNERMLGMKYPDAGAWRQGRKSENERLKC
jgi:hypothetical protein